jgi:sterol desaturase/sphingolipid hydroxylase (fatty acid hydroxylase superfamily)
MDYLWALIDRASTQASTIALVGLPILLIELLRNRGEFAAVLRRVFQPSTRVNLQTYAIDLLIVVGPLSLLIVSCRTLIERHAWTLFPSEWFAAWPLWAVIALAVFVGDGIAYFRHRLEHAAWLWPSHSLHHSDESMNVLTTLRFHPINRLSTVAIDMAALFAIGFPAPVVLTSSVVRHVYGIFVHANVPWTLGPLGWVLVSPAMHRWHHVKEGPGVGTNFASVFSVFDRLFGTHYCPGPCDQPTGVEGVESNRLWPQWAGPFVAPFRSSRGRGQAASSSLGELK